MPTKGSSRTRASRRRHPTLRRDDTVDTLVRPVHADIAGIALDNVRRHSLDLGRRALDDAAVRERLQIVESQGQQIGSRHYRTFSATHSASSPGGIAPTWAPIDTSVPAMPRS